MSKDRRSDRPKGTNDPELASGPRLVVGGEEPVTAGVPIGMIVSREFVSDPHLAMIDRPHSPVAERYRRLATQLELADSRTSGGAHVIVTTSAVPNEGKTTTAVNLAIALAESKSRKVLLVDGDLRRPSVANLLRPSTEFGLREVLEGRSSVEHTSIRVKQSPLVVLPAGVPTPNPLQLLKSDVLEPVFGELRAQFDWIVVDTPPTVPFSDAAVLGDVADGVVLVILAGSTARPLVDKALETLERTKVLGVVLNKVAATPVDRYYYRYDDYDAESYYADDGTKRPKRDTKAKSRRRKKGKP